MDEQIDAFIDVISPRYDLYCAVYQSRKNHPNVYTDSLCNVILTSIMGGHERSWRVVGMTENALRLYVQNNFEHSKVTGIRRAHTVPRIKTTQYVLSGERPLLLPELACLWFERDTTILCAKGENKAEITSPYFKVDNPRCALFPGKYIGWRHSAVEKDFLKGLAKDHGLWS